MRYSIASCLFGLMLLWVSTAQPSNSQSVEPYADGDALAVYRTLIPSPVDRKDLLIVTTTENPTAWACKGLADAKGPSGDYADALADLLRVNHQEWRLESLLQSEKAKFISQAELRSLFRGNVEKGWKKFYKKHPSASGYISFSAVGFNRTHTIAAVYIAMMSCSECGHGSIQFLKVGLNGWEKVAPPFSTCDWIT